MNRIRQPFNVNSLAQVAALAALEDEAHVLECVRMIEAGRHYLYDEFKALGLKYVPSRANFILVDVGRSAADIYQKLLHQGVIVRPAHVVRHGQHAAHHGGHARGEPAPRQGTPRRAEEEPSA